MELTNRLKRRFIKDCGLSIALTDSPYFEYFIDLYDKYFNTKAKLNSFMEIVNRFNTESEVLDYLSTQTDTIIYNIKNNELYQEFLKANLQPYAIQNKYPSGSIFKEYHTGKELISIDLSKANFQAMNYFNKDILNAKTYRDLLISNGVKDEYVLNSKYIRQVIFGNLNSKRLDTIEKHMIYQIVEKIETLDVTILSVTSDEIVLEGSKELYEKITELVKDTSFDVAVELFTLKTLRKEDGTTFKSEKFFVKEFIAYTDEKPCNFEIKATDSTFYPQFFKLVTNQEISDNDLVFLNEGFIASYKEKLSGTIS